MTVCFGSAKPEGCGLRSVAQPVHCYLGQAIRILLAFVMLSLAHQACEAQQLSIEMRSLNKMRSGGHAALDFDLMKRMPGNLKGRLTINLTGGATSIASYTSDEMILSQQRTRTRIMLPNTNPDAYLDNINMHASFRTANATIDLGSRFVRVPRENERLFRVLYATNDQRVESSVSKAVESIEFEQFWQPSPLDIAGQQQLRDWQQQQRDQELQRQRQRELQRRQNRTNAQAQPPQPKAKNEAPEKPNISSTTLFTTSEHTLVGEMSNVSLWYCNFNVVVLFSDAFENIRKSQLTALEAWVKAGGSLCIEPLGLLDDYHIEFLERIKAANDPKNKSLALTPGGTLQPPDETDFENLYYDLGRIVLIYKPVVDGAEDDDTKFDPADWDWRNQGVSFLWQYRQDQLEPIATTGAWKWHDQAYLGGRRRHDAIAHVGLPRLTTVPVVSGDSLFDNLMPDEVKIVPLSYIALILVFYVLAIGPLDYFLLGIFKLRRFTWITFPLTTLFFTMFTVWLSNDYLSSAVERTFLSVVDVGDDGKIIRENRIELLYTGSTHDVTTSLRSSLFTPLNIQRFSNNNTILNRVMRNRNRIRNMNSSSQATNSPSSAITPMISGRPPTSVEVTQTMPQWTPQLNRIFTLKCRDETAIKGVRAFNWKKQWNFRNGADQSRVVNAARRAFGPNISVQCFQGQGLVFNAVSASNWPADFISDICVRRQGGGLFGVVSRIAPHGGTDFEDLTMLDPSNPKEYLLVIAVQEDDGMRIYRKLYRTP
jgi:hypothetical protein